MAYDNASNVIATTTRQRFDNAEGTGELQTSSMEPKARVSYAATYPDGLGRTQIVVDYGTYGAEPWTRSGTIPERPTEDESSGGGGDLYRTTRYEYNLDNNLTKLVAENSTTGDQTTEWVYGVRMFQGSTFDSNGMFWQKIYPNSTVSVYTYNRAGQAIFTVEPTAAHTFAYDKFGRLIEDAVSGFGDDVDQTVVNITRSYESRGLLETVTSLNNEAFPVNQVQFTYNAYSQLVRDYQQHAGAVNFDETPWVGYNYAYGGENTVRRTGFVYPDGATLGIDYNSTAAQALSVPDALSENSAVLCSYRYLGIKTVVGLKYNAARNVELTYENGGTGDAGDRYTGLDRFGRLVETIWKNSSGDIEVQSTYGRNGFGAVIWRRDEKAHTLGVNVEDSYYKYDGLHQVTQHQRGNLIGSPPYSGVTTPEQQEDWMYDSTGNWDSYDNSSPTNNQTRTYNECNEITDITSYSGTITPSYDLAGNMTSAPAVFGETTGQYTLVWDAWSRLVRILDGEAVIVAYAYDGLTRRTTKTNAIEERHFYYNDQWKPVEERVEGAVLPFEVQFTWGLRDRWDLLRRKHSSAGESLGIVLFCLRDYLDPVAIIGIEGDIIERYAYDAFGRARFLDAEFSTSSSSANWEFLFHGEFLDEVVGLYNYGYRYYHAALGRWLSKGPSSKNAGTNPYLMVDNEPLGMRDLYGLEGTPFDVASFNPIPIFVPKLSDAAAGITLAVTDPSWGFGFRNSAGDGRFCTKLDPAKTILTFQIRYDQSLQGGPDFNRIKKHEMHHVHLVAKQWNAWVGAAKAWEKCYCTIDCSIQAELILKAQKDIYMWKSIAQNLEYDIVEYGMNPATSELNLSGSVNFQKRQAALKTQHSAEATYNQLVFDFLFVKFCDICSLLKIGTGV